MEKKLFQKKKEIHLKEGGEKILPKIKPKKKA